MGDRFKRILAFIIDWNITLIPFILLFLLAVGLVPQTDLPLLQGMLLVLAFPCLMLGALLLFVLRDMIWKGRSLGKRLLGLWVYDRETLQTATPKQCSLRGIFFPLYFIDGILLLVGGKSIGDRVAHTAVLSQKNLPKYQAEPVEKPKEVPTGHKVKTAAIVIGIAVACLVAFIGAIQIILNAQKDKPEYKVAYQYLVTSDAYQALDAQELQIRMNQYSLTQTLRHGNTVQETVQIGFLVDFEAFRVVCHRENGQWQVCEECTSFR